MKAKIKLRVEDGRNGSFEAYGDSYEELIEHILGFNGVTDPEQPSELVRVEEVMKVEIEE